MPSIWIKSLSAWILLGSFVILGVGVTSSVAADSVGLSQDLTKNLCNQAVGQVPVLVSSTSDVKQLRWQLEELWTLGGDSDEDVPLGFVGGVVYQDNSVYVLDTKESKVYVMDLSGNCVDLIDVSGQGPGQCDHPLTILGMGSGKMALIKGRPAKVIITDFYYNYPQTISLLTPEANEDDHSGDSYVGVGGIHRQGDVFLAYAESHIVLDRENPDFRSIMSLSTFSAQGEELQRYLSQEMGSLRGKLPSEDMMPHYAYGTRFALSQDGHVYVAPYRDKYLIYIFSLDGSLEKVIGREFVSRKRSEAERTFAAYMGNHSGTTFEMEVEDNEADILGINLLPCGLLVRSSRSEYQLPQGVYTKLDLFTEDRLQAQVNLMAPGNAQRDELIFLSDELLAVVKGNRDAIQFGIENFVDDYQARAVQVSVYRIIPLD